MAGRNRIHCYICDIKLQSRVMTNISGDENEQKRQIAIRRRSDLNHPPQQIQDNSCICLNCNRSINTEIDELVRDSEYLQLNVVKQTKNSSCIFCNQLQDLRKLSVKCRVKVFIIKNIYIPESTRCCLRHLDINGFIPRLLLEDLQFIKRPPITREQFQDLYTYCDSVLEPGQNVHRHVSKKHLLTFLCKIRQGLSDDFLRVIFRFDSRQAVSLAITTSFSMHKGHHLIKPALIVAPDGYILDIHGPYFSDSRNNNASMIENEMDATELREWFNNGDIFIVVRGYSDALPFLENLGINCKLPALLQQGQRQLNTDEANDSRLITKTRWIVEARNGHIKSVFKFFEGTVHMNHAINIGDFYRIAGAILNKYREPIIMEGANAELAQIMLQKFRIPNVVQTRVEMDNLHTRNARWVHLNMLRNEDKMPTDLKHYLDQPMIDRKKNLICYWINFASVYPTLSVIAKKYLAIVATSVPSERLFSRTGNILTDSRNRLSSDHLQQLLLLNSLTIKDWQLNKE
ncbi:hypothetical protein X777_04307 [Ooceraea biroi]|uniref:HAT C-terminal dimerisation domain-containing protein n=1 Tax=Ooceraea biroi TaxID=2015173 RepID=A0A026WI30_OOCBI|nr:hypothetical protein X777_04307 [Ooceraea biroi]